MNPKHKIGEVVKVYEYYADMIPKSTYFGLIVDVSAYRFEGGCNFIYHILPNEERQGLNGVQTAEEFAIEAMEI